MAHEKVDVVLAAARRVFLRYGYRRVTMGDLAEAAQMSRPALYAVFPSKEQIFVELLATTKAEWLAEIRAGVPQLETAEEQLAFAFEVWCVRPFELIRGSPDAADLLESSQEFATEVAARASAEFEGLLAEILGPQFAGPSESKLSPRQVARILRTSAHGLKTAAEDADDLRQLIGGLCAIVLKGIRS